MTTDSIFLSGSLNITVGLCFFSPGVASFLRIVCFCSGAARITTANGCLSRSINQTLQLQTVIGSFPFVAMAHLPSSFASTCSHF